MTTNSISSSHIDSAFDNKFTSDTFSGFGGLSSDNKRSNGSETYANNINSINSPTVSPFDNDLKSNSNQITNDIKSNSNQIAAQIQIDPFSSDTFTSSDGFDSFGYPVSTGTRSDNNYGDNNKSTPVNVPLVERYRADVVDNPFSAFN